MNQWHEAYNDSLQNYLHKGTKRNCVLWYCRTGSQAKVQRFFRLELGTNESATSLRAIRKWYNVFQENGSVETPKKQWDKMDPKFVTNEFDRDPKQ